MAEHEQQAQPDPGSFVTGFTLGLLAGAAGLYLFGTKDGTAVRKRVAREWNEAKETLLAESAAADVSSTVMSLRELAIMAKTKVLSVLDGMEQSTHKHSQHVPQSKNKKEAPKEKDQTKKTTRTKKQLFKGL